MKKIEDICILVQARLASTRVPKKMIRPFGSSTLVDILFEKLKKSQVIPKKNIYFSVWDEKLKEVGRNHGINIFERSERSALSEGKKLQELFEWHNKLPFKYIIMISACNPLLKIETIDSFVKTFLKTSRENCFAVFEKRTYYWDMHKNPITDWKDFTSPNTKYVDPVYEAAHCLYASRMDLIGDGYWMSRKSPPDLELYLMEELESFDIDYEWQFKIAEVLYEQQGLKNV
jgi:CMP-N-acetylneuraminic acid synthetase